MHLTIEREALHVALAQTARVVERRTTIPVLSNVLLEAEGDRLTLTATDLDMEVRVKAEAIVTQPGAITVPAGPFSGLVAKLPSGPISLVTDGGAQLSIGAGRSKARLNALPDGDFPRLDAGALPISFALPPEVLIDAIEAVSFAISSEEIRYYLNGIYIHASEDHLVAVATDGHRLSRWRRPMPDGAAGMPGVIVPRKAVGEIAKLASEGKKAGADRITVALSDAKIRVEIGQTVLTSKLIDGTFPDYSRVIPREWASEAVLDQAEAAAAIDRVATISSDRGRAIKLTIEGGLLKLDATNPDTGTASEEMTISGGPDTIFETGFNSRYLADVLAALRTETVILRLAENAGAPCIFVPATQPAGGADRLIVLMPMRV